jgi:cell fate regulator YaaT (PSP1 superfamily)
VLRASVTARTMAQLGEDITNVGVDISKLREQRKFRGECDMCGRKCYTKTLFKTTPLTIQNMVENGRCLKCNP